MSENGVVPVDRIENIILVIRGQKVILARELAELYGVTTGNLNKAVKRNIDCFPNDFMFQLTAEEYKSLRFHFGILEKGRHSKYLPYAFTEQGVAMLSSVLKSKRAVQVNIEIMRAFVRLRRMLSVHKDLERKLTDLEQKYDKHFKVVFDAIRALMSPPAKPRKKIGFIVKEKKAAYGKRTKGSRRKK
ncbi:MAG: ORF6N domain-containing protein [Desulfobacteraceae bacterium]|uniref:ORF6N domain-containing protein n=1 Tax=Candidatus Desulfaltia bathyphila TaxID=2841697 RepID=A0A8J6T8Q7_9BACT|nr:ORF6N domain-containing protein [Candidatus Desulfaltia bathyphila]